MQDLFHIAYWLARTYARGQRPSPGLTFDPAKLPKTSTDSPQTVEKLRTLEEQLRDRDLDLSALKSERLALDAELQKVRTEIAEIKKTNAAQPDTHDYSEAETRDYFIDLLLREAGWTLSEKRDREFEVSGMPNDKGIGYVDYVLWGDNGKPLGLVEAKRTRRDAKVGQQQANLYADCLEKQFGQRPVIFYSNGYEHWIWDDATYPPRPVHGFYKKDELELLIQRRRTRKSLSAAEINPAIVERYYQTRAIRRIGEAFERDHDRKSLLVMATGAGKTRTVIALVDLLTRCNWVKRVLFLADRVALVNQAAREFTKHLPDSAPINLVKEKEKEGRVYVSTYPTMMGLIDETVDGQRRFGPGHFDLVVIDEAHRSVFQKYKAIFDYFDSFLVGLTATPAEDVHRNTYSLFELETGVAVNDKFLVPMSARSVPLRFQREGIKYDDLSDDEKDEWDALDWDTGDGAPDRVEAEAVNKWLFNKDTVDKVLEHLMTKGVKVAGGDRLGKTIIFAKNQAHADFIAERFDANYPHYKGEFARVITYNTEYAQNLIDNFSLKDRAPHIAISVDMLDTGIDVPDVVNLVFFKLVRSKTKFWQMVGRGTRLCPDLFGPGQNKAFFSLFDYCQNLEFFSQNPATSDGGLQDSLSKRLFKARLELVGALTKKLEPPDDVVRARDVQTGKDLKNEDDVRKAIVDLLRTEVAAMNVDNFIVRPKRRLVEKYREPASWTDLTETAVHELSEEVAGLPTELEADPEEAKRFDLLLLNLQLALLKAEPAFARLSKQVKDIAGLLEEKAAIPMVQAQLALILDIQTDEWWQDVTTPMLEIVRLRLRDLVRLIEKERRKPIYTDFEDTLGTEKSYELIDLAISDQFERFRAKARAFLKAHQDHITIHKLRMNEPLTASDLAELERMLIESGVARAEELQQASKQTHGLGLFVRSLVGLDREAAKRALAKFLTGGTLSANQIEFVSLIVDHLTQHGVMDPALLYESPFTDLNPQGPEGLFPSAVVTELVRVLERIKATAAA